MFLMWKIRFMLKAKFFVCARREGFIHDLIMCISEIPLPFVHEMNK